MEPNSTSTISNSAAMDVQTLAGLAHTLQTAAIATLVIAVCAYIPKLRYKAQLAKLPVFDESTNGEKHYQSYLQSAKAMYMHGYKKFKDSVYLMVTSDGENNVVIPSALLPEVRKLPDDVVSFPGAVESLMEVKYTKIVTESALMLQCIKADLTPALSRLTGMLGDEVDAAVRKYLPPCDDWTEVNINSKVMDIITKVSGRIFVGQDLSQDPEYLECGSMYTFVLFDAVRAIKLVRPWLRPFLVPRLPEMKKLREMEKRAANYLQPIVRERLEAQKNDPNWQKPDDMMQWLLTRSVEKGEVSVEHLAKVQLGLIFAGIHTTTMTATNIVYTLAVTPEYIEPIREEVRNAMHDNDGKITTRALQQMVKLDSYMKEVFRLYPPGLTSFNRRVLKGFTLSNGQYIPAGVNLEVPSQAIYSDSEHYPDGTTFDGFRHYKLRQGGTATDHARNQFVTTNESNLAFGYGRHACPGRFFAANEIKLIVARLVLDFDIKMPGDAKERHAQMEIGRSSMPHPGKTIMLKRV